MRLKLFQLRRGARVGIGRSSALPILTLVGALLACDASSSEPWDRFLQNPDAPSFEELSQKVDGARCGWGKPANNEVVPDRFRGPLFDLIATGNESAFLIGLSVVRCFDGGDLEDFYQGSGRFMEQRPREFLVDVTERNVALSDVASMAASVPTNDDADAALKKVAARIELLRGVNDERVSRARAEGLRALQEQEQNLRRMKESLEQGK